MKLLTLAFAVASACLIWAGPSALLYPCLFFIGLDAILSFYLVVTLMVLQSQAGDDFDELTADFPKTDFGYQWFIHFPVIVATLIISFVWYSPVLISLTWIVLMSELYCELKLKRHDGQ